MESALMSDQFRFFSTYTQWSKLSAITKCHVTDICVPSCELHSVPLQLLQQHYRLHIWIILSCPSDVVLQYLSRTYPFITGFLFRVEAIQVPNELFELYNVTLSLKQKLLSQFKIGWTFQWHQFPFSPKHFGWTKKNELSRPHLPSLESVLDVCFINWNSVTRAHLFNIFFKRLVQLRIPSNIIVVPYIPEKPVLLNEKNVFGLTTHHLSAEEIPFFFPLEKPQWLDAPGNCSKKYKKGCFTRKMYS